MLAVAQTLSIRLLSMGCCPLVDHFVRCDNLAEGKHALANRW